jgi:signal transduction histidine kinase
MPEVAVVAGYPQWSTTRATLQGTVCSVFDTAMRTDNTTNRAGQPPTSEQVAVLVAQLRRNNEDLNHFVRALSHDMGANLMLIEGSVSSLKRSLVEHHAPAADEGLAHVEACLRQSRRLLNDMVELGRTGSVPVEPRRVELGAVLDEVLFEQRELLASRRVEVEPQRPLPTFWCNEDRLKQIVVNLIRNAVAHGCDRRQPRIAVSAVPARDRLAGFRVHDNGPGIEPRFCEEIFLPGRRLAEASAEGSGMGLAIVRKIAELYGGAVFVDPQCPTGTAFVVRLPKPVEAVEDLLHPPGGRAAQSPDRPTARHASHSPQPHNRLQDKLKRHERR